MSRKQSESVVFKHAATNIQQQVKFLPVMEHHEFMFQFFSDATGHSSITVKTSIPDGSDCLEHAANTWTEQMTKPHLGKVSFSMVSVYLSSADGIPMLLKDSDPANKSE